MGTKLQELTNPNGCLARAAMHEPILILRAKDLRCAAPAFRRWIEKAEATGLHDDKLPEARQFLVEFEAYGRAIAEKQILHDAPPTLLDIYRELLAADPAAKEDAAHEADVVTQLVARSASEVAAGITSAVEAAVDINELHPGVTARALANRIQADAARIIENVALDAEAAQAAAVEATRPAAPKEEPTA